MDSLSGLGRSPREGHGKPLQYSCLENLIDPMVHRVSKSWTQLKGLRTDACPNYSYTLC